MSEKVELAKLPKYVQEYIRGLQMQRDLAVKKLDHFLNCQAKSRVFTDELLCVESPPKHRRRYIYTDNVTFQMGREEHVDIGVRLIEDILHVSGHGVGIWVKPVASNVVEISLDER